MTPEPVPTTPGATKPAALDKAVARATKWLLSRQHEDGHWVFELEADATISSEFVLLRHYLGNIDVDLEQRHTHALMGLVHRLYRHRPVLLLPEAEPL